MLHSVDANSESTTPLQATGYVTLAAFAKWMLAHPLGSLPAGIKIVLTYAVQRIPYPIHIK